jgi:hypothetical protein
VSLQRLLSRLVCGVSCVRRAGYCFVNLRSAIEFIMVMDGAMLSISQDEFER